MTTGKFPRKTSPLLADALAFAGRGFDVFPLKEKAPLAKWKTVATSHPAKVERLFRTHTGADGIGWRLPEGYVVADVDDRDAFAATGLELPDAPSQQTASGGEHRLYKGLGARQVVKQTPGLDTRVGGKGYVRLYSADAFEGDAPEAPGWLLHEPIRATPSAASAAEPMGSRDDILAWLGRLARATKLTSGDYLALLQSASADGRIVERTSRGPGRTQTCGRWQARRPSGSRARKPVGPRPARSSRRHSSARLRATPRSGATTCRS